MLLSQVPLRPKRAHALLKKALMLSEIPKALQCSWLTWVSWSLIHTEALLRLAGLMFNAVTLSTIVAVLKALSWPFITSCNWEKAGMRRPIWVPMMSNAPPRHHLSSHQVCDGKCNPQLSREEPLASRSGTLFTWLENTLGLVACFDSKISFV